MRKLIEILLLTGGTLVLLLCVALFVWRNWHADKLIDEFNDLQARAGESVEAPAATINNSSSNQIAIDPPSVNTTDATGGSAKTVEDIVVVKLPDDRSDWSPVRLASFKKADESVDRVVGVFHAPTINIEAPVLQGTDDLALDMGLGWLDKTAFPGAAGNAAIAGHRDSFFRRLGNLQPGDVMSIRTLRGDFSYRVTGHSIVEPDDVSVLNPVENKSLLTLITCYPFRYVGDAPQRYIVHAELIGT